MTEESTADQAADAAPDEASSTGGTDGKRGRSTIVFPYFALAEAAEVARVVHSTYGGRCEVDQLAGTLKQKASSGAFRLKLSATRIFGLVTVSSQTVSATDLGSAVADERTAASALAEAFLRVPLYSALHERFRNRTLPNDKGLEAAILDLGVAPKQVTAARQALQRSAETAGFFAHGRDRLIMPAVGRLTPEQDRGREGAADDDDTGKNGDERCRTDNHPIMKDPLIIGLLEKLPDPATGDFPEPARQLWLATLEMNLAYIYSMPKQWKFDRPDPEPSERPHGEAHTPRPAGQATQPDAG